MIFRSGIPALPNSVIGSLLWAIVIPKRSEESALKEWRFYVYLLASKSRRFYTGMTNSLFRRVMEHKSGEIEGFTKRYKINRLVYYEVFKYVNNCIAREKQIKGWSRAKRVALITSFNPTWEDLAADWGTQIKAMEPEAAGKADSSLRFGMTNSEEESK